MDSYNCLISIVNEVSLRPTNAPTRHQFRTILITVQLVYNCVIVGVVEPRCSNDKSANFGSYKHL